MAAIVYASVPDFVFSFFVCVDIQYPVALAGVCMFGVEKCLPAPGAMKL